MASEPNGALVDGLAMLERHGILPDALAARLPEDAQQAWYLLTSMYSHRGDGIPTQYTYPQVIRDAAKALVGAALRSTDTEGLLREDFQARVADWMGRCFPPKVCNDRLERRDRLVEEALELAQTLPDFTADRAHALVEYVFGRPVGVTEQEIGGVSVTLAALCVAEGVDQQHWAETELARIDAPETIQKIRAKQAAKPTGSALPVAHLSTHPKGAGGGQ
ncbi:hypothetical protein [Tsuneonella sp. HG222]